MFQQFLIDYQAEILTIFGLIITAIIGLAERTFERKTGIDIDDKHGVYLKEALMTGAAYAIVTSPREAFDKLKALAIVHAKESVPDAITHLVPGDGVLDRLATRAVLEALERFEGLTPDERDNVQKGIG